jgi:hypothetical protein
MTMALRDLLSEETTDALRSAQNALHGRSETGLSGLHEQMDTRPIAGRLVDRPTIQRVAPEGVDTSDLPELPRRPDMPDSRPRQPFGSEELQLAWPARRGYRNYWFNDVPGRITRAKKAGYSHVIDPDTGDPACIVTDKTDRGGRKSYLMEIPMQWYQEDMQRQAEALDRRLNDIRHGRAGPGAEDHRYVPKQGIKIEGR